MEKENKTNKVIQTCEKIYLNDFTLDEAMNDEELRKLFLGQFRSYFVNAENDRIKKLQKDPKWRMNVIFSGTGGSGKTTMAKRLAELFENDQNESFWVSDFNVGFLNYGNERVLIFDEMRINQIKSFGINKFLRLTENTDKNNLYLNVKYSYVKLSNNFNLITTSQNCWKFLECLTDRYYLDFETKDLTDSENAEQITRRFNYVIDFKKEEKENNEYLTKITFWEFKTNKPNEWKDKYEIKKEWEFKTTNDNYEEYLFETIEWLYKYFKEKENILENKQKQKNNKWIEKKAQILGKERFTRID